MAELTDPDRRLHDRCPDRLPHNPTVVIWADEVLDNAKESQALDGIVKVVNKAMKKRKKHRLRRTARAFWDERTPDSIKAGQDGLADWERGLIRRRPETFRMGTNGVELVPLPPGKKHNLSDQRLIETLQPSTDFPLPCAQGKEQQYAFLMLVVATEAIARNPDLARVFKFTADRPLTWAEYKALLDKARLLSLAASNEAGAYGFYRKDKRRGCIGKTGRFRLKREQHLRKPILALRGASEKDVRGVILVGFDESPGQPFLLLLKTFLLVGIDVANSKSQTGRIVKTIANHEIITLGELWTESRIDVRTAVVVHARTHNELQISARRNIDDVQGDGRPVLPVPALPKDKNDINLLYYECLLGDLYEASESGKKDPIERLHRYCGPIFGSGQQTVIQATLQHYFPIDPRGMQGCKPYPAWDHKTAPPRPADLDKTDDMLARLRRFALDGTPIEQPLRGVKPEGLTAELRQNIDKAWPNGRKSEGANSAQENVVLGGWGAFRADNGALFGKVPVAHVPTEEEYAELLEFSLHIADETDRQLAALGLADQMAPAEQEVDKLADSAGRKEPSSDHSDIKGNIDDIADQPASPLTDRVQGARSSLPIAIPVVTEDPTVLARPSELNERPKLHIEESTLARGRVLRAAALGQEVEPVDSDEWFDIDMDDLPLAQLEALRNLSMPPRAEAALAFNGVNSEETANQDDTSSVGSEDTSDDDQDVYSDESSEDGYGESDSESDAEAGDRGDAIGRSQRFAENAGLDPPGQSHDVARSSADQETTNVGEAPSSDNEPSILIEIRSDMLDATGQRIWPGGVDEDDANAELYAQAQPPAMAYSSAEQEVTNVGEAASSDDPHIITSDVLSDLLHHLEQLPQPEGGHGGSAPNADIDTDIGLDIPLDMLERMRTLDRSLLGNPRNQPAQQAGRSQDTTPNVLGPSSHRRVNSQSNPAATTPAMSSGSMVHGGSAIKRPEPEPEPLRSGSVSSKAAKTSKMR